MQIEDFSLGKCIGKGEFGEVFLTTRQGDNKLYATKKISKQKIESPSIKKHFLDEIEILQTLNHKNIIKFEAIKQSTNNFYIITEYYNGGGLYDCLKQYKIIYGKPFPEIIVQHLMRQIVDALVYLHQRKIIHRDLKLENLLINYESEEDKNNLNLLKAEVKIIDFGFSTYLNGSQLRYSILGSPINMDPILLTKLNNEAISYLIGYDEKADIWSLGTLCYEMATGELLFQVQNISQLVQKVEIGVYHIPTYLSKELVSFLEGMLQYLGKDRLSAVELSTHPFLTKNVNEFQKIDLTDPNNKIDGFGLIMNIKKGKDNGINPYEIIQKLNLNPYLQQTYNNPIRPQGYNYFGNTGPKYYVANMNRNNYGYPYNQSNQQRYNQYNQAQLINQYQNQNKPNLRRINTYQQPNNNIYKNLPIQTKHQSQKQINNLNGYDNRNINNNINFANGNLEGENIHKKNLETKEIKTYNNIPNSDLNNNMNINHKNDIQLNQTNIPFPDTMNPSNSNNTNKLLLNKHKVSSSFMKQDFSNFYQQFMPKSRLNNSFINKQNQFYDKKYFTTNEPRKEISSDALDNLFDFNIGKELEPEPDINVENDD